MSRHATDWAWETDPGSSSLKLILLSMADRADEYNLCYPSIERLVKDTCLNKKTVQAGLISLMKMGLISDTGERKGATKRVRVFSLNITKNGNIKGNREGGNEPENGNIPKNGMLNDPKNGIQNQSYNQSFNQERESRTKTGDSVPHDPGANNAVMNNFVPPGGLTMFGVSPASMIGGNGTPWLVGTSRIEKYQKTFLRHCRPVLQQMLAVYPRLENYVDERNHVAKAWLHWLGFRLEEAAPYGALGLNFHRFHMERK